LKSLIEKIPCVFEKGPKMKILITGENGFIGKKLAAFLSLNTNYKIISLVRSQNHVCIMENVVYIVGDFLRISDL
jgi:nucleoside-diphosphate-sugar epimerase